MIQKGIRYTLISGLLYLICTVIHAAGEEGVEEILARLPAKEISEGQALLAQIVGIGPPAISKICSMLREAGKEDDSKARFALHGLALYVTRPGAEADRVMFEGCLLKALAEDLPAEVKAFLIRQIQLAGKDRSVAPLGEFLEDSLLCDPAAQALVAIRTPGAAKVLAKALPGSEGKNRLAIIQALGSLEDRSCVEVLLQSACSEDPALRRASLQALANIGDPRAFDVLAKAAETQGKYDGALAGRFTLQLAGRMAGTPEGDAACARICRDLIRTRTEPQEHQLVCAALETLVKAIGIRAKDDLLAACAHNDEKVRDTVLCLARSIPGLVVTAEWFTRSPAASTDDRGFTPLFNGTDLTGWIGDTQGYLVKEGSLFCCKAGTDQKPGGNLYTEKEYGNFILRFEFRLTPGANNGLGIRTPFPSHAAYDAMELQILDDTAEKYKDLKPYQYHGSVYGVVPAKPGHLRPVGEWNIQEVIADGRQITVKLNGATIVDADIHEASTPQPMDQQEHPGLKREKGHIAFLGHGDEVEFRNMRIMELHSPIPPDGFVALFNGKDLTNWKGLVGNPASRAKMSPEELARAQAEADGAMGDHWMVVDGTLVFDGKGSHLCTKKDYGDFELLVDWKIEPGGDSGIYLRGSPQVQIWDPAEWPEGSGGLYNNQIGPSKPLKCADNPVGEWNRFRIKMIGERVTVHLNHTLVVDNVVLENYWERDKPIYPEGQLELQSHGTRLFFKNIFIREIPRAH